MADRDLLGQLALEHRVITEEQLRAALEQHKREPQVPLGAILVRMGFLDFTRLRYLLNLQEKALDETAEHSHLKKKDFLFGRILFEYGFATQEQVNECLRIQADLDEGSFVRLGELLVQKGYVTAEGIHTVLDIQNKKILFCRRCRTQYNVSGYLPHQRMKCAKCGELLTMPEVAAWIHADGTTQLNPAGRELELHDRESFARLGLPPVEPASTPAPIPTTGGGRPGEKGGTTIKGTPFGSYELIRRIAAGPRATVFKAWDRAARRFVAIKVLPAEGTSVADLDAFRREAELTRRLSHPAVVKLLDAGVQDGKPYLAMEFVEGATLKDLVEREDLLAERALEILHPVAEGVEHAHRQGVLHRDLKPQNILVDAHGDAKVGDFGISLEIGRAGAAVSEAIAGTAAYMAPEQVAGGALDPRTDVYALGACLYEAVTGRPPYVADTPAMVVERIRTGTPPAPRELAPELPAEVEWILQKAMAREPGHRYPSAQALADDMERYLQGVPLAGRNRAAATLTRVAQLAVLWAVIFLLAALIWWRLSRGL